MIACRRNVRRHTTRRMNSHW